MVDLSCSLRKFRYSAKHLNSIVDELGMPSASHRRYPIDSRHATICSITVCSCVSSSYPQRSRTHSLVLMCTVLLHTALWISIESPSAPVTRVLRAWTCNGLSECGFRSMTT